MKYIITLLSLFIILTVQAQVSRFDGLQKQLVTDGKYRLFIPSNDTAKPSFGNVSIGSTSYVNQKGTTIIAYGNSITAGTKSSKTANSFISVFSRSYGISSITNNGVGGTTLDDFFTYTVPAYTSAVRYITMMWGTNEATTGGWDTATYHTKYKRSIDTLIAKGYPLNKIVLIQCPPVATTNLSSFAYVDSLVAIEKGVRFIPEYYYLSANGYNRNLWDGTHPTDAGHNLIAGRIVSALNDADAVGLSRTQNIDSSNSVVTNILSANAAAFANDVQISGIRIGNYGDSTATHVGYQSGINITGTGLYNSSFGFQSMKKAITGNSNTAIGIQSLYNLTTANNNVAAGFQAGINTNANSNTFVGYQSGLSNTTGSSNAFFGNKAGYNNTGAVNTIIGAGSMLPYNSSSASNYDNTIYITGKNGHDSVASTTSLVGINNAAPSYTLDVNGTGRFQGAMSLTGNLTDVPRIGISVASPAAQLQIGNSSSYSTSSAFSLNGFGLQISSNTYTSTGSSGTIAAMGVNTIATPTLIAGSATTLSDAATLTISNSPFGSTNVSITRAWALRIIAGNAFIGGKIAFTATNTAAGTTGAQTINGSDGSVNFAAGAQTLVVTNSLVTTSSHVQCTIETDDATADGIKCVTVASGSFTIKLRAAATAETKVSFWVRD